MDLKLFLSTFGLIFIAEIPDKTALAIMLMAARERPWPVFFGAAGGFLVQSLIAVLFGSLFSALPVRWVRMAAGVLFLVFAVLIWREKEEKEAEEIIEKDLPRHERTTWGIMGSAFVMIFIAEWGDLTQLATATLAAHQHAPVTIFCAATLALWSVTVFGVLIGNRAQNFIKPHVLQRVAAVTFALVGLWLFLSNLLGGKALN